MGSLYLVVFGDESKVTATFFLKAGLNRLPLSEKHIVVFVAFFSLSAPYWIFFFFFWLHRVTEKFLRDSRFLRIGVKSRLSEPTRPTPFQESGSLLREVVSVTGCYPLPQPQERWRLACVGPWRQRQLRVGVGGKPCWCACWSRVSPVERGVFGARSLFLTPWVPFRSAGVSSHHCCGVET